MFKYNVIFFFFIALSLLSNCVVYSQSVQNLPKNVLSVDEYLPTNIGSWQYVKEFDKYQEVNKNDLIVVRTYTDGYGKYISVNLLAYHGNPDVNYSNL
jgi:hypothetical protein